MSLHDGEFRIDDKLVAGLIAAQMPYWRDLRLVQLEPTGTANVAYRLGTDMLVRLPRLPEYDDGPLRESEWLPRFSSAVGLQVPDYLALGSPTDEYPSPWSVLGWIEGENATSTALSDLDRAAERLGAFVLALRNVETVGAPDASYRGKSLLLKDAAARSWIGRLPDDIDQTPVLDVWESCLAAPVWEGLPTWFHGDLHSGNLLAREGELVAVIDFEGSSVGDPAIDLIAAWWLFDASSRRTFLRTVDADAASIRRAMGWALFMCIAAIPYYETSNPAFAATARSTLIQILNT